MPFYEYICPLCGHEFEQLQKFSDAPLTNCPACHEEGLQKKISAPAFHLKGGGWYVTDFKDGAKPKEKADNKAQVKAGESDKSSTDVNASKSDDKPGTDTKAKSETKTESAPVVKPKTSKDEE
jgi:putative FmdB family regulatory protein